MEKFIANVNGARYALCNMHDCSVCISVSHFIFRIQQINNMLLLLSATRATGPDRHTQQQQQQASSTLQHIGTFSGCSSA